MKNYPVPSIAPRVVLLYSLTNEAIYLVSTNASTLAGLAVPPTSGSGLTIMTAPVVGKAETFLSEVTPYLSFPRR